MGFSLFVKAARGLAAAFILLPGALLLSACGEEHSHVQNQAHEAGTHAEHDDHGAHGGNGAHAEHDEHDAHGGNGKHEEPGAASGERGAHNAHNKHDAAHAESGAHGGHGAHSEHGAHADHAELPAEEGIPGESVYQLESTWQRDTGETIRPARLSGKVVVGAMIYASCEYACPIIVSDMKHIEAALPPPVREKTRFVLFSFDPERDTVETLAAYRRSSDLLGENWTLLRAVDATVRELAVVLGVRYKKVGEEFAHSNLIFVLDEKGVPAFRKQGLGNAPDEAAEAVRELAARIP